MKSKCTVRHLTHELKSWVQIIRRRVDLKKIQCWKFLANFKIQTVTFWPRFLDLKSLLPTGCGHFNGSKHSSFIQVASTVRTTLQWSPASSPEHSPDFPRASRPWKRFWPICSADLLLQWSPALVLSVAPRASKRSPIAPFSNLHWTPPKIHPTMC